MPKGQQPKAEKVKVAKPTFDIMPPGTPKGFMPAGRAAKTQSFESVDSETVKKRLQEKIAKDLRDEVERQRRIADKKKEDQIALARLLREAGMQIKC